MSLELIPIDSELNRDSKYAEDDHLRHLIQKIFASYNSPERQKPWIGYLAQLNGEIAGSCGFKSNPTPEGTVEIAFETFELYRRRSIATDMCRSLIEIVARQTLSVVLIARTVPENWASERVLEKCGFIKSRQVLDYDEEQVNEWKLQLGNSNQ